MICGLLLFGIIYRFQARKFSIKDPYSHSHYRNKIKLSSTAIPKLSSIPNTMFSEFWNIERLHNSTARISENRWPPTFFNMTFCLNFLSSPVLLFLPLRPDDDDLIWSLSSVLTFLGTMTPEYTTPKDPSPSRSAIRKSLLFKLLRPVRLSSPTCSGAKMYASIAPISTPGLAVR